MGKNYAELLFVKSILHFVNSTGDVLILDFSSQNIEIACLLVTIMYEIDSGCHQ
uniref:Uncharacterized protein n=1 Tax=Candidozyma auris TaxID=498019 RepID=A0A0L0NP70_CANAR